MIQKINLIVWLICACISFDLQAQTRHDANWVFGINAGIHFDSVGNAVPFQPEVSNFEMSSCISDSNGSLLFYFDNSMLNQHVSILRDSDNNIVNNSGSIQAYPSSTSGAVIIPNATADKYMIFHLGNVSSASCSLFCPKLFLSVVSYLDGSLLVENKNHLLLDEYLFEKISAVRHANGKDWWLIAQTQIYDSLLNQRNRFYRFLIQDTIVIGLFYQDLGIATNDYGDFAGQSQISQAGNKLGLVRSGSKYFEVYDFDRCTGLLALIRSEKIFNSNELYGMEFSGNERFLYISSGWIGGLSSLYQIDLNNNSLPPSLIDTSSKVFCQLQLAIDNKIYMANQRGTGIPESGYNQYNQYLSVINQPDSVGISCNFQPFNFFLGDSSKSSKGLPHFPNYNLGALSIYEADAGNDTTLCSNSPQPQKLALLGKPAVSGVQYQWEPNYNISSDTTAQILAFPDTSTWYYLMLTDTTITNSCKSRLDSVYVEISTVPDAAFVYEHENDSVLFTANWQSLLSHYQWDFGDGTTATGKAVKHQYHVSADTNITVRLIINNNCGSDTSYSTLFVSGIAVLPPNGGISGLVRLFPNPTTGTLHIQIQNTQDKIQSITMYDVAGKQILHQEHPQSNAGSYSLSFGEGWGEAIGLYYCKITFINGASITKKVIKQ